MPDDATPQQSNNPPAQPAQPPAQPPASPPAASGQQSAAGQAQLPVTFEAWINTLPEGVQTLYEQHIGGLKSALTNERDARTKLEGQIRDLSKQAEAGSKQQQQLDALASQLAEQTQQTTFFETAHQQGVKNLRLAYLAAKDGGLFGKDGSVDFSKLKGVVPELFPDTTAPQQPPKKPAPKGDAGAGQVTGAAATQQSPNMNTLIRRAAGRSVAQD